MITQYTITNASWTAITTAGQSGSCWLSENEPTTDGGDDIRVVHSATGAPSQADIAKGKRVRVPRRNNDVVLISADSASDIYYARSGDKSVAILNVDVE